MTITRVLPAAALAVVAAAGPAAAQYTMPAYSLPARPAGGVPAAPRPVSVSPWGGPAVMPAQAQDPPAPTPPPAPPAAADRLDGLTAPPAATANPDPVGTLTGPAGPNGLPPGSYVSPWYSDGPGCCGPTGRNGLVAYELYGYTGPNIPFGAGAFTDALLGGWTVGGGGRSQFFNPEGDAAWAIDLGMSYTYNRGSDKDFLDLFIRQAPGQFGPTPDRFTTVRLRALHRTAFNFAVGRDLFFWGPGLPGAGDGWNLRVGADVGGRWGTAHTDLVPLDEGPGGYARRQKVYHGVFLAAHSTFELPVGGWVWVAGWRAEYGYDWMNIAPPINSDVQSVNLLLTTGFRF